VTIATDAAAAEPLWRANLTRPLALLLGNEAGGLAEDVLAHVAETYAIPMPGSIESLNVAVAGSIFLFEATRQRTSA
ncbi:MAG TPA: TrmH family RNA methyltransferase, partial [Actinomycetota bacterium]|nr:TrmH family RNA methyltransferase [Actinomycetota bacterium]